MEKTTTYINECIIENVKFLIQTNGMIQNDFARICNSTNGNISKWIHGIAMPPIGKIVLICEHFNIKVDDFVLKKLETIGGDFKSEVAKESFKNDNDWNKILSETSSSEILEFLIYERKFMHPTSPFRINSIIITKLEEALMWLQKFNNEETPGSPDKHHHRSTK